MRILHVDTGCEMRGGQWQALYLIRALVESGHGCTLLVPPSSPLWDRASKAGLEVRPASLWRLGKLSRGADIVHAHSARAHTLAAISGGAPLVVARRVAFPVQTGLLSRWKYRRAQHYIAVSGFVKRRLLEAAVPEERVTVVHDGVPLLETSRLDGPVVAPATEDSRKATAVAREMARRRGLDVLFSTDLMSDLAAARLFLYLTHEEGFGSGALLAMSAGIPVVASRVGGLPEMIEHGVTGWLTENDPDAVGDAVERLLARPQWAAELGRRAREIVSRKFTINLMARETLAVYQRVAGC